MPNAPSKRLKTDDAGKKKDEDARAKKEKRQERERISTEKKSGGWKKRIEAEGEKALKISTGGDKKEATDGNHRNEGRKGSHPHIGCCPMGRMGGRADKRTWQLTRMF